MKQLIDDWRSSLHATGNFDREELNELESHLLDEMENVEAKDLSEEEKLLVAQHRLGSVKELDSAYKRKGWISFTHLSWSLQMLMAFFLLREVVVLMSYVSGDLIIKMELSNSLVNYGLSIAVETVGLVLLVIFLRYIVRLNYKLQSAVKPNLLTMGACLLVFLLRSSYFFILGNPMVNYESIIIAQFISYLPVVLAFFAILIISVKGWKRTQNNIAQ